MRYYRRRRRYGRKRTGRFSRRAYRRRRYATAYRPRRRYRTRRRMFIRKNQKGIRRMKFVDSGFRWKDSGMHMIETNHTAKHATGTTRWNDSWDLNSPYRYYAKARAVAGHEIYPTGMREKTLLYKEYRCNGGKCKLTFLNNNLFGCMIYWKLCHISADESINQQLDFENMESNDLDHAHGVSRKWLPPATVLNDGTTIVPSSTKIVQRWSTRRCILGTGAGMTDQWRAFTYPDTNWNSAATDCAPIKNSGNTNYQQARIIMCWSLVTALKAGTTGTWSHETFTDSLRNIHYQTHFRSYCQYRCPKEHEPNVLTNDQTHFSGADGEDPTHWDEWEE